MPIIDSCLRTKMLSPQLTVNLFIDSFKIKPCYLPASKFPKASQQYAEAAARTEERARISIYRRPGRNTVSPAEEAGAKWPETRLRK